MGSTREHRRHMARDDEWTEEPSTWGGQVDMEDI